MAQKVLENKEFAAIIKTQFAFNSPSIIYKNNQIINNAVNTGRFIELSNTCNNSARNNIYPMEIGLTSDICVGGAVGGTASLEAALSGTRSVLINEYYLPSKWDILSRKNIVF